LIINSNIQNKQISNTKRETKTSFKPLILTAIGKIQSIFIKTENLRIFVRWR